MRKQHKTRKYNFADAELYMLCKDKVKHIMRDLEFFQSYNYTVDKVQRFIANCEKFKAIPDDDEMVGNQMILTESKNKAAEDLRDAIRGIMTRVAIKYSNRSGQYRKYGVNRLKDMSDPQLLFCGRRVARVAKAELNDLIEVGISTPHTNKVLEASVVLEKLLNEQQDIIAERDMNVENKITYGNELYAELILICKIGKDIWQSKDPVKVANYVVYIGKGKKKSMLTN